MDIIEIDSFIYDKEEFINRIECGKILGVGEHCLNRIHKDGLINKYSLRKGKITYIYYKKSEVEKLLEDQKKFLNEHITLDEARERLTRKNFNEIDKSPVPNYAKTGKFKLMSYAIKKDDIEKQESIPGVASKKTSLSEDEISKHYYSYNDMREKLGINKSGYEDLNKNVNLTYINFGPSKYFLKSEIDEIAKKQEEYEKKYIDSDSAIELYTKSVVRKHATPYEIPYFLRKGKFTGKKCMYEKSELEELKRIQDLKSIIFDVLDNPNIKDEFERRLEANFKLNNSSLDDFYRESPYSSRKTIEFFSNKLDNSNASDATLRRKLILAVQDTYEIYNMLNTKDGIVEIYTLTTEYLDYYLSKIIDTRKAIIIKFLDGVYDDLKDELKKQNVNNKKIFDVNKLKAKYLNKYDENKELLQANIYSIEEFLGIFEYCIDIEKHITNSIDEIKNNKTAIYVSNWLYSCIHLNNGWRHGDVSSFKEIYIDDLLDLYNIFNEDYFKDNRLTLAQSQMIISRIIDRDFKISKTGMSGYFFCCDEVAPSLATAIVILTLYKKSKKIKLNFNDDLLDFATLDNKPTESQVRNFFKDINIEGFKFGSKKMNSTLMTIIYSITYQGSGDGDKALEYIRKIRGHVEESESPLHYINLSKEEILNLSKILFDRGEFGYIYDKLVRYIYSDEEDISDKTVVTDRIKELKLKLGNMLGIEQLTGFMSGYTKTKKVVLKDLDGKTFEEKVELLTEIYMGNLISKEQGIHCLLGIDNCPYKDRKCTYCPYSIITLYALHDICSSFLKHLHLYRQTELPGEKIKLSVILNHLAEHIFDAFKRFGEELVSEYFNMSFKQFRAEFKTIDAAETIYLEW